MWQKVAKECDVKNKAGLICVFELVSLETILKYYSRHECAIADVTEKGVQMKNGTKKKINLCTQKGFNYQP